MQAGTSHAKVGLKIHPSPPRPLVPLREFLWQSNSGRTSINLLYPNCIQHSLLISI